MTPQEVFKGLASAMRQSKCGLFATMDTIEEANVYAETLITASSKNDIRANTQIALGIYHNTLVEQLAQITEQKMT